MIPPRLMKNLKLRESELPKVTQLRIGAPRRMVTISIFFPPYLIASSIYLFFKESPSSNEDSTGEKERNFSRHMVWGNASNMPIRNAYSTASTIVDSFVLLILISPKPFSTFQILLRRGTYSDPNLEESTRISFPGASV